MSISYTINDIHLLELGLTKLLYAAFQTNNSLYLLGSGASAGRSKMEAELVQTIVESYLDEGIYDVEDKSDDSLASTFLWRYMAHHEDAFLKELSRKIPDGFIKAIVNEEYAQLNPLSDNPEYQVFLLARKPSTIIDMNYEGFSSQFLDKYHHVISMHGTANARVAKHTKEIREDLVLWNLDVSHHTNIIRYPGEKQSNKTIAPYEKHLSDSVFPKLLWLVIIGYSFANTGSGINDIVLYEFIKERLEHYKEIKIIIINPNPENIAALFEKELDRVTILPAYWNSLTRSIKTNKLILGNNSINQILRDYYRFLEI